MVTGAIWSDFDDDGWIDLLITHEWGPVAVWKNDNGKLTNVSASAGTVDRLGRWTGISAADVDGDGDMDIATTEENGGWGVIWFENPSKK